MDAAVAGLIGGAVAGGVTSFLGPLALDTVRERRDEGRRNQPRREMLERLLKNHPKYKVRSLEYLSRVTGTTDEECRVLLIEIDARGVKMESGEEGWGLISRNPFDEEEAG